MTHVGYNLTQIASNNSTSVLGFVQGVNNELMGGWLGLLFIIGIALVLYMSFMFTTNDPARSISATAFITFILGLMFSAVGLLNNRVALFVILVASAASIAFTWRPRI